MAFSLNFKMNLNFRRRRPQEKMDFAAFCVAAGYPVPYPKQVEMVQFALFSSSTNRMVLGSRGTGKTDYITICGVAYYLFYGVQSEVLIVTKERDRGKQIVAEVIEVLKRLGVEPANNSTTQLRLKGKKGKEPNLFCIPIRGRGFRGHHPTLIIMEDPITPEDTSAAERDRVKKVYDEIVKLTSNVLIIGQPVHKLDLYQQLRNKIPTHLVKWGDIPELDADLDALRAAGVSEPSIQASYFLNIVDANSLPFQNIELVDHFASSNVLMIDPAREGSDFTAFAIGGVWLNNFVVCGYIFQRPWYDCLEEIKIISQKINIQKVIIETNGVGALAVKMLRDLGIAAGGINTTENKHKKIMKAAPFVDDIKLFNGRIFNAELNAANDAFIEQVQNYEYKVAHDDAPDAMAMLLQVTGAIH